MLSEAESISCIELRETINNDVAKIVATQVNSECHGHYNAMCDLSFEFFCVEVALPPPYVCI